MSTEKQHAEISETLDELLSRYDDEQLTPAERESLERLLREHPGAAERLEQYQRLSAAISGLAEQGAAEQGVAKEGVAEQGVAEQGAASAARALPLAEAPSQATCRSIANAAAGYKHQVIRTKQLGSLAAAATVIIALGAVLLYTMSTQKSPAPQSTSRPARPPAPVAMAPSAPSASNDSPWQHPVNARARRVIVTLGTPPATASAERNQQVSPTPAGYDETMMAVALPQLSRPSHQYAVVMTDRHSATDTSRINAPLSQQGELVLFTVGGGSAPGSLRQQSPPQSPRPSFSDEDEIEQWLQWL